MAIDVSSTVDFSQRLMEALESSRAPRGEGLVSGERSPVPKEVAEAFRALLENGPDPVREADAANRVQGLQGSSPTEQVNRTEAVSPGANTEKPAGIESDLAADKVGGAAPADILPTPTELYQIQFRMHMQVFESKYLSNVRDSVAQQFESTLKSQS